MLQDETVTSQRKTLVKVQLYGTDFGRARRQRNLLVAVKQKILSAGFISQIVPFMSSLGDDLRTDFSPDDVKILLTNATTLNKYQVVTLALTDQNYLQDTVSEDGQAILESKDGLDNWTSVHNYIANELSGKTKPVQAVVQVENGTTIPGLAGLAANRLKNENIQVLDPTDAASNITNASTITVFDKNVHPDDLVTIEKEFGTNKVTYSTTNQTQYNVLVVVGQDYNTKEGKKIINEP